MRNKKTKIAGMICVLVLIICVIGAIYFLERSGANLLNELSVKLEDGDSRVYLREIIAGNWSEVCYLGPYMKNKHTSRQKLETVIGVDLSKKFQEIPVLEEGGRYEAAIIVIHKDDDIEIFPLKSRVVEVHQNRIPIKWRPDRSSNDICMEYASAYVEWEQARNGLVVYIDDDNKEQ